MHFRVTIPPHAWGLRRYHQSGHLHFITFSCLRREPLLNIANRALFERALERSRVSYKFLVYGYVVMPEHVHLLISEPERANLASAIQAVKQSVTRRIDQGRFWEERYYDFNLFTSRKFVEKIDYIHRNPVERGLVESPEQWQWSSFGHYQTGQRGLVEIESRWTAREREKRGIFPKLKRPRPSQNQAGTGHP